jgi:probable phosphoglycerate mutase
MLFYFVRHGQTSANAQHLLAGSGLDHPLTPEGHQQAERLAKAIRKAIPHPIHRLVCSGMTRTRETAKYLADHLALPLELDNEFREWHLGEWEGKLFTEYAHLLLGDGEPATGEARKVFYSRVERAWKSVHSDTHPYLIVSHGAVWLALQDLLKIPRFKVSNCDLVRVEFSGEAWRAEILVI